MAAQPIYQQQVYQAQNSSLERAMNKAGAFVLEYWALLITIVLGIIVLAALSVPFLTYLGLDSIAKPIFYALHLICAQIPSHSFYIMGHQLGMCARNMSIYGSMFASGLIFLLSKKRLPGIPWWLWVLMILPMAYDGLTQMFGLRESTWELRVITGVLFGLGTMWFALPFIQKTLKESIPTPVYSTAQATPPVIQPTQYMPASANNPGQFTPVAALTPADKDNTPTEESEKARENGDLQDTPPLA